MELLNLLIAILLPWAAGSVLWRAFSSYGNAPGALLRTLGYGFFMGMALTTGALWATDALTGSLSRGPVLAVLGLVIIVAGAWTWRQRSAPPAPGPGPSRSGVVRLAGLLLLAGIVAHFTFSLIEVLAQPVFPWDGWTVWVYRAKAWFYAEHLAPITNLARWFKLSGAEVYTTPALNYPLLPSLIPLWAAMALGSWHETLVNVPVLACALAIAIGLAGNLRASGVGPLGALLAAYLLFSTPLFGVHMSLGGYADIWLAGFAGLGMTGVLYGLVNRRPPAVALGLVMLALGMLVKVEGFVWLAAGLAITVLSVLPPRHLAWIAGGGILLALLAWLTGFTFIDLPGLGRVGWARDVLYIPFKGIITLRLHDVGGAYGQSAFLLGSWHVLWSLVLTALALLIVRPQSPQTRVALAFFAVFVSLQISIFVFTTEGAWAQDFTAINRMPLQMLPAILYLVILTIARTLPRMLETLTRPAFRRATVLGLSGGILITAAGIAAWQWSEHGEAGSEALTIEAASLRFVLGGGRLDDGGVMIERYQDGIALLSSGPVTLSARDYSLLDVDLTFDENIESLDLAPAFFWRRADQPRTVARATLLESGLVELSDYEDWRGDIIEYGFLFMENEGEPARLGEARLMGPTTGNQLRLLLAQWTVFETWTQRSAHWLPGGAYEAIAPMSGVVLMVALLSALLAWLRLGRREGLRLAVLMLLMGWIALDLRWGHDRLRQAELSLAWLENLTVEERLADGELGIHHDYLETLRSDYFGTEPLRILIVRDPALHKYYGLRGKYQLLPHAAAVVWKRLPPAESLRNIDYVLFLGDFAGGDIERVMTEGGGRRWGRLGLKEKWQRDQRRALELLEFSGYGTLFRVNKEAIPPPAPPPEPFTSAVDNGVPGIDDGGISASGIGMSVAEEPGAEDADSARTERR